MEANVAVMGPRGMPPNGITAIDAAPNGLVAVRSAAACGATAGPATDAASTVGAQQYPIAVGLNGASGRISLPPVRGVQQTGGGHPMSPDNNNSIINGNQYRPLQQPSSDRRCPAGNVDERTLLNGVSGGSPGHHGNGNCNASRTPVSGHPDSSTADASPTTEDRQGGQVVNPSIVSSIHSQYGAQHQQQQQPQQVIHQHGQTPAQSHQQKHQASSAPMAATLQRCAACGREIADRFLLHAIDRYWHTECLRCSACHAPLADLGSTCFTRSGMTLCRPDYMRMFGLTGTCRACRQPIPPNEFVMKTNQDNAVYHVTCFSCVTCHSRLVPGDRYGIVNGRLVCEQDYVKAVKNQLQQQCQPLQGPPVPHAQQLHSQQPQLQQPQPPQQSPRVDAPLSRQHHKVC